MERSWSVALGMMLVLARIISFLFPGQWREVFNRIASLSDGRISFLGVAALLGGFAALVLVHFYS